MCGVSIFDPTFTVSLFVSLYRCLSICISVCLSLSIYLSICISLCLCLFLCLSLSLWLYFFLSLSHLPSSVFLSTLSFILFLIYSLSRYWSISTPSLSIFLSLSLLIYPSFSHSWSLYIFRTSSLFFSPYLSMCLLSIIFHPSTHFSLLLPLLPAHCGTRRLLFINRAFSYFSLRRTTCLKPGLYYEH